jgi:predicted metal-dependent phosphoesterase TrpH
VRVSALLLAIGIATGTALDRPRTSPPLELGGYRVLAVDFHLHSSMWSDGTLTPWGLVLEAERHGLDAIAITGHNEVADSKIGRWFARAVGGPTVLTGEEIVAPEHHVVAVGIERAVGWREPVASEIDEVHRQGGIAIAAHPGADYWPAFDDRAMQRLDGAEICHPAIYKYKNAQRELETFSGRAKMAAIGSSDFHGIGPMGLCRTYVFARDDSEQAILDAVRARRTVVYGLDGRAYGDPALVRLAASDIRLREAASPSSSLRGWPDWVSRICGVLGLAGVMAVAAPARKSSRRLSERGAIETL